MIRRIAGALALVVGLAMAAPALAGPPDCLWNDMFDAPNVAAAKVAGPDARTYFIKNGAESNGACPSSGEACREKSFLVRGDAIFVEMGEGPFVCATFKSPKGIETRGLLMLSSLDVSPATTPDRNAFVGVWRRDREAAIELKPKGPNGLQVIGSATWGAFDPGRVKRGAVNIGSIEAISTPRGNVVAVGEKYDGVKPPSETRDSYDCRARLRLFGPYLVVDDNSNCGGNNVRFNGIYIRQTSGK